MQSLTKQFTFCLMFLCLGCSALPPQLPTAMQNYGFYTKLRTDKTNIVLDVFFRNDTEKTIKVTHGFWDCVFRFELWVSGKKYTYPPKQVAFPNQVRGVPDDQFGEVRTCPAMAYSRNVDKKSSLRFATIKLPTALTKALIAANRKYSGQFYFGYSINDQPPAGIEVYQVR
jgi:hypothetical protein